MPRSVHQILAAPGKPLEDDVKSEMEARFRFDFSRVRVHTDGQSAQAASKLGSVAFSVGPHLVFAADRYRPDSPSGRSLLAHELTHVVQSSGESDPVALRIGDSHDREEIEADAVAAGRSDVQPGPRRAKALRRAVVAVLPQVADQATEAAQRQIAAARQLLSDPRLDAARREGLRTQIAAVEGAIGRYRASGGGPSGPMGGLATATTNPVGAAVAAGVAAISALAVLLSGRNARRDAAAALAAKVAELAEAVRPYAGPTPEPGASPDPRPGSSSPGPDFGPLVTAAAVARGLQLATDARGKPESTNDCDGLKRAGLVGHECWELDAYPYAGRDLESASAQALRQLQAANPKANLDAYKEEVTDRGPCPGKGSHTNVRDLNGVVVRDPDAPDNYFGSIVCCPCCVDEPTGPIIEARCGLI
ncbi:eCIS core domain-containing protein [Jidongwangia harbinensis]|uniref:eCIS core domain-containing protein n=1 Tax=Jidongwangia harbinensis TaxID=2878561 RepID=UPI001CD975F1|nr:DUF4157 domain-containing protein [Jidongwangia harbinensis]MCA2218026.1 DUF4157 domain-containing protein [Jidongwangia harbinensis]